MNNLPSYCGLVNAKTRASDKDLPVQSTGTVFNLFAIGALMPIMTQILRMRDLSITAFCVTSSMTGITTILLATDYHFLYLANFLKMFSDVVTVGIRSALTKIVGERDVGKVQTNFYFKEIYLREVSFEISAKLIL